MDEKYKFVIRNVDKLPGKGIEKKTNKEYESLVKEIDEVIGKKNAEKTKKAGHTRSF